MTEIVSQAANFSILLFTILFHFPVYFILALTQLQRNGKGKGILAKSVQTSVEGRKNEKEMQRVCNSMSRRKNK